MAKALSAAERRRKKAEEEENYRFSNRLRFDQAKFWDWNKDPEPRSMQRSTWPAFSEHIKKYGAFDERQLTVLQAGLDDPRSFFFRRRYVQPKEKSAAA